METLKAISLRKSVRSYKPEQISDEVLEIIINSAFKAPIASAKYDSLHITVIQNTEIIKKMVVEAAEMVSKMINKKLDWDFGAPTLIIVSSTPAMMPGIEFANAACVLENMVLAATDQKVDSLIWGGPTGIIKQDALLKKSLGIPDEFSPVLCASFGYATDYEEPKEHTISVNRV
ncbi:nitroreductase family protein [Romboutsia ilealis]|uniref:Nitroreductase family protein n=1 Tax=Romboutsia faecis TaxID=2764597 RepID=A0ABR7JRH3_9FIRM|nr:nitroreductase family protein [Romboutsia faecis]MBC5997513.1 nitroreductase family protein [Romboutsia faecis]MRN24854.1 nitroreductase family protein [Romboutsia ilealis]